MCSSCQGDCLQRDNSSFWYDVALRECKLTCAMLGHRNPEWGLPDIDVLRQLAFGNGIRLERIVSRKLKPSVTITTMSPLILFVYFPFPD